MINITTFYNSKNPERARELEDSIRENAESGLFEKFIVLVGGDTQLEMPGVEVVRIEGMDKCPFSTMVNYCNEHFSGEICFISNTDITFDSSISKIESCDLNQKMLAISRKEKDGKVYVNPTVSQDVWVFRAPLRAAISEDVVMGVLGCDNVFCGEVRAAGYKVVNCYKDINCWHNHHSLVREYKPHCEYSDARWCAGRVLEEERL